MEGLYKILETFQQFDLNENGTIELEELTAVIRQLDPDGWPDRKLKRMFASMDMDRDGCVNYEEFLRWAWGDPVLSSKDAVPLDVRGFRKVVNKAECISDAKKAVQSRSERGDMSPPGSPNSRTVRAERPLARE
mmetsp:Transcript_161006/g.283755  ORF Transcript_161006/g.283755 Transcript_161006/m.283755 type:complete len:134 (+) Transcript_161006:117-518(+)